MNAENFTKRENLGVVVMSEQVRIAVEIVAAFISKNSVPIGELPKLIESVHKAIRSTANFDSVRTNIGRSPAPAAPIYQSITPDYLVCLEDGKKVKFLRRHLMTLSMTPEQYKLKWGLPLDYPMVAPSYSAKRSKESKQFWLGRRQESKGILEKGGRRGARPIAG